MFSFLKRKNQKSEGEKISKNFAKQLLGKKPGRKVFGFLCSPDISAQLKLLADQLHVPVFALVEHALQLSAGLIKNMVENEEESALLRNHLTEVHVRSRTVEKIVAYDENSAKILDTERMRSFEIDRVAHEIVIGFLKRGITPTQIMWMIDYGARCQMAVSQGKPIPPI